MECSSKAAGSDDLVTSELCRSLDEMKLKRQAAIQERQKLLSKTASGAKIKSAHSLAKKRSKRIKTMDICFVFDITASMQLFLDMAAAKVEAIVSDMHRRLGDGAKVRVAFVGYRDYQDEEKSVVMQFTDASKIKQCLVELEAKGGGDVCEDVLEGLEKALDLKWAATTRVLFLLSQTPHHGYRFYNQLRISSDVDSVQTAVDSLLDLTDDKRKEVTARVKAQVYDLWSEDPRQWGPMDHGTASSATLS